LRKPELQVNPNVAKPEDPALVPPQRGEVYLTGQPEGWSDGVLECWVLKIFLDVIRSFILNYMGFVQMLDLSLIGNPVKIGDGPAAVTPTPCQ
jgi:hypothetical protein